MRSGRPRRVLQWSSCLNCEYSQCWYLPAMGFEKVVPSPAEPARPIACRCAPPEGEYGPGTLWRCDACGKLYVFYPQKARRFVIATLFETVWVMLLTFPLLWFPLWSPQFYRWRSVRYYTATKWVGIGLIALCALFVAVGQATRPF